MPLLAAAAQIADSLTPIANAPTTSEGATRDGRSRRLDIHTSSSIVYCPWPRFMGLHPARLSLCAPLCVAREIEWCDHDYPRWGEHTLCNGHLECPPVLGSPARS